MSNLKDVLAQGAREPLLAPLWHPRGTVMSVSVSALSQPPSLRIWRVLGNDWVVSGASRVKPVPVTSIDPAIHRPSCSSNQPTNPGNPMISITWRHIQAKVLIIKSLETTTLVLQVQLVNNTSTITVNHGVPTNMIINGGIWVSTDMR
jgi:hypothetical protein